MQVFFTLLIFAILIGAVYLIKIKIDEGTLTEKERKKFINTPIKISSKETTKINAAIGISGFLIFVAVAIIQTAVGYIGIEHHFGKFFAIVVIILAFTFRFILPLTIGTFLGAMNVWGWPWYGALALAAPGFLFIVPVLITSVIATVFQNYK
jgi:hypothetical protein